MLGFAARRCGREPRRPAIPGCRRGVHLVGLFRFSGQVTSESFKTNYSFNNWSRNTFECKRLARSS